MEKTTVLCPAKVNLFLNIVGKVDDMHLLHALNQSVDLYDYLEIEPNGNGNINITCNNPDVPLDQRNSVYKALALMKYYFNILVGFNVKITKNIPLESGLGGESTDAAGAILAINEMFQLNLPIDELCSIGNLVGSDVPFCLVGGSAMIKGTGNEVTPISINLKHYVIVKPPISMKTKEMFKKYDETTHEYYDYDVVGVGYNDFEIIVPEEIHSLKRSMINLGAVASNMTGSGSAVIGLFADKEQQLFAYQVLKDYFESYQADACEGVHIITKKARLN